MDLDIGCGYLIARGAVPPRTTFSHDFVLHAGGVAVHATYPVHAAVPLLDIRQPVLAHRFPGLVEAPTHLRLPRGRIPLDVWQQAVDLAVAALPNEVFVAVVWDEAGAFYRVVQPAQETNRVHVRYTPVDGAVLELHSHTTMAAWPSQTDVRDEQSVRVSGVLGRLDTDRPEVSLWAVVKGHARAPAAWEDVFDCAPEPFRMLTSAPLGAGAGADPAARRPFGLLDGGSLQEPCGEDEGAGDLELRIVLRGRLRGLLRGPGGRSSVGRRRLAFGGRPWEGGV